MAINSNSSIVACEALSFAYGQHIVLDQFTSQFSAGVSLIKGYSGCGKSTLLKLLAGYLSPSSGRILVEGQPVKDLARFQRKEIGFLFQQLNLLPLASIRRNLDIIGSLAGIESSVLAERRDWLLERLGLEDLQGRKPKELSGGQQQRAALARAMMKKPKVLLLDEPTSGLDDLNTEIIKQLLCESVGESCCCLISTHDDRLTEIASSQVDFNQFLPVEERLKKILPGTKAAS